MTKKKINPNLDCKKGKPRGVNFRTGAHIDKKKEARKKACRGPKKDLP